VLLARTHKKKTKGGSTRSPIRSLLPIRNKGIGPERSRGNRSHSPTRNPIQIRMARSVWNTPDPSILEMLQEEEANEILKQAEEAVKSLTREERTPCSSSSPLPLEMQSKDSERIGPNDTDTSSKNNNNNNNNNASESKQKQTESTTRTENCSPMRLEKNEEYRGDESPLAGGIRLSQYSGAIGALFERSCWVGVDIGAFNEDEDDCED